MWISVKGILSRYALADADMAENAYIQPSTSPFEPMIKSLLPPNTPGRSVLDSTDLIIDLGTLVELTTFIQSSTHKIIRIDVEYTLESSAVVMHKWQPKVMYGPGEPHRGWVLSYTKRITQSQSQGTTQVVKYNVAGLGVMGRYLVGGRFGDGELFASTSREVGLAGQGSRGESVRSEDPVQGQSEVKVGPEALSAQVEVGADTTSSQLQPKIHDQNDTIPQPEVLPPAPPCPIIPTVDRSQFVMIKVHSVTHAPNLFDILLQLTLSQLDHCLIAPHAKGDFSDPSCSPIIYDISNSMFDKYRNPVKRALAVAMGLLKDMISITKKTQESISFIGNKDGSWTVLKHEQAHKVRPRQGESGPVKLCGDALSRVRGATGKLTDER
jgi:hypothetical protein